MNYQEKNKNPDQKYYFSRKEQKCNLAMNYQESLSP